MEQNVFRKQQNPKLFVLKDAKSTSYGMPITAQTTGVFIRDIIQYELQRGQAVFARHPEDFSIFEIGEYDPTTGNLELYENKNCLGLVSDFRDLSQATVPGNPN